jgi:nicotinamidase-related amidase
VKEKAGLNPTKTALLLLHWQNELVRPGGLVSTLRENLDRSSTVDRMRAVLEASRDAGLFVVYVNAAHRKGYPELVPGNTAPLAAGLVATGAFIKGTWGTEVIEELKPLDEEIEIVNYSTSAFVYTELDLLLHNRGITTVVLTGLATNWVVESTARDAFNRGYVVWTVSDCCNSSSQEAHEYTIANVLPFLGVVCDSESFTMGLGER